MISNIQALRAIAALFVLCVHLDTTLAPVGIRPADMRFGEGGVDLFFVISGFVMVHTVARRPVGAGTFLVNRIARVVPLYWLVTLAVFAVALIAPSLMSATRADPFDLLRSLLFVPFEKLNGRIQPLFFLGWTLNYEMAFYAVFAASIGLSGSRIARAVAMTCFVLVAAVILGAVFRPKGVLADFYTSPILLEFAFGMVIGLAYRRGYLIDGRIALPLLLLAFAAMFGEILRFVPIRTVYSGLPGAVIVAASLSLERRGWALRQRPVQLLGAASYALYLFHPFVAQACDKLSAALASRPVAVTLAALAVMLSVAVAVLVHLFVERPIARWLARWFDRASSVVDQAETREIVGPPSQEGDKPLPCR